MYCVNYWRLTVGYVQWRTGGFCAVILVLQSKKSEKIDFLFWQKRHAISLNKHSEWFFFSPRIYTLFTNNICQGLNTLTVIFWDSIFFRKTRKTKKSQKNVKKIEKIDENRPKNHRKTEKIDFENRQKIIIIIVSEKLDFPWFSGFSEIIIIIIIIITSSQEKSTT